MHGGRLRGFKQHRYGDLTPGMSQDAFAFAGRRGPATPERQGEMEMRGHKGDRKSGLALR